MKKEPKVTITAEYGTEADFRFACRMIARAVMEDLEKPEKRKQFAAWYKKKYGVDYVWTGKYARLEREEAERQKREAMA